MQTQSRQSNSAIDSARLARPTILEEDVPQNEHTISKST